jgi:CheY-like chemotaxis protein
MGARILVADDSVTIQKVVELTFSKEDFTLIQARNGEETLRKAKEVRPDLILLDLVMPDKSGYEVCAALRDDPTLRTVPIILLTGTFESFDQQRGTQAGANDYISKPFESQVLIGKVKQLLFAKALGDEVPASPPRSSVEATTPLVAPLALPDLEPHRPVGSSPLAERQSSEETPAAAEAATTSLYQDLDRYLESMPDQAIHAGSSELPGELRLEDLNMGAAPEAPEVVSLDLESLGLDRAQSGLAQSADDSSADAGLEIPHPPEPHSLDDMLEEVGREGPISVPRLDEPAGRSDAPESVFELPATEALPLPMVEAGRGEPPALTVEDLLGPHTAGTASEPQAQDVPELDLAVLPEEPQATAEIPIEPQSPPAAIEMEFATGLPLEESSVSPEGALIEPPVQAEVFDYLPSPGNIAGMPSLAGVVEPSQPAETPPIQSLEEASIEAGVAMAAIGVTPAVKPAAAPDDAPSSSPPEMPAFDMAAMRQEVTARVAHDLTRELSGKLMERFEKIVWEVVPDLAELLIGKEIERIRRLAEEEREQSS